MKLKLYDSKNNYIGDIDNDNALLGSYPIDDGMRIHVIDNFALVRDFGASDSTDRWDKKGKQNHGNLLLPQSLTVEDCDHMTIFYGNLGLI